MMGLTSRGVFLFEEFFVEHHIELYWLLTGDDGIDIERSIFI